MEIKVLFWVTIYFTTNLKAQFYETIESNEADLLASLSGYNYKYCWNVAELHLSLFLEPNTGGLKTIYSITKVKNYNEFN